MSGIDDQPRTRRAILAAAVGGVAATVVQSLGRPAETHAANGDVVKAGNSYTATAPTAISNSAASSEARGLVGRATAGSGATMGVEGVSGSAAGIGVGGRSANGTGVLGFSGEPGSRPPASAARTGVFGNAAQSPTSVGVLGKSTVGYGVRGEATTGVGVLALATSGQALVVNGRAIFTRSGRANVPANQSYVDVTIPGGLSSAANVLATIQTYRPGVAVAAVRINFPSSGKVRIYLTKIASTTSATPVAYFVLG